MIKLSDWQTQGKFVELHGYKIFTREGGNPTSPTLLLIHGYPSASWDWESLWGELIQHYHVITLDMLGFGLSEKPKDIEYLITLQADIYSAFLTTLNISSYHILAHDYGDTVAQELLARQIDGDNHAIIDSICFLNGGLFPETHKPKSYYYRPWDFWFLNLVLNKNYRKIYTIYSVIQRHLQLKL